MARAIGLLPAMLLPVLAVAAQNGGNPASGATTLQTQLQHAQAELKDERAQTAQLRARVGDLEKDSAANRAALDQRDREIEALKRKLAAISASREPAPTRAGSH